MAALFLFSLFLWSSWPVHLCSRMRLAIPGSHWQIGSFSRAWLDIIKEPRPLFCLWSSWPVHLCSRMSLAKFSEPDYIHRQCRFILFFDFWQLWVCFCCKIDDYHMASIPHFNIGKPPLEFLKSIKQI